jgi:hypothetical protein
MRGLVFATTVLLAAAMAPTQAAVIQDLGVNPSSTQGDFSNGVGGTTFADQYTFQLVGAPSFITFASATNSFAKASDFISNFTGQLFRVVGAVGGGDDVPVNPPVSAVPCPQNPTGCQITAGTATLPAGSYYLQLTGTGNGTAGYGGNLTTAAVGIPLPAAGAGLPGVFAGALALLAWHRRKRHELA